MAHFVYVHPVLVLKSTELSKRSLILLLMLGSKRFIGSKEKERLNNSFWGRYTRRVRSNSLVYFGIPFFAMVFIGHTLMTQFAAVRYEQHDRRHTEVSQQEALQQVKKRKVDLREEFYRLQHMDLDSWEQKRVPRLKGEDSNKWD